MTSDQKAVCGTCGMRQGAMCACGFPLHRIRSHRYAGSSEPEGDPHHPFISAPVVPSDDALCDECGHVLTWGCHGPAQDRLISILGGELEFPHPFHAPGTGGMYADKRKASAPPIPSQDDEDAADADIAAGRTHPVSGAQELIEWLHAPQDAEGDALDGNDATSSERRDYFAWRDQEAVCACVGHAHGRYHPGTCACCDFILAPVVPSDERVEANIRGLASALQGRPVVMPSQDAEGEGLALAWGTFMHEFTKWLRDGSGNPDAAMAGVESSIRADYEELVKAAQRVVSARRRNDVPDEDSAIEHLVAALTRIEESLGGRK